MTFQVVGAMLRTCAEAHWPDVSNPTTSSIFAAFKPLAPVFLVKVVTAPSRKDKKFIGPDCYKTS